MVAVLLCHCATSRLAPKPRLKTRHSAPHCLFKNCGCCVHVCRTSFNFLGSWVCHLGRSDSPVLRTYEDVMLSDLSLVDYIAVKGTAQLFLPHTQGRYQMRRFRKALCPIVERLVCSMMMHGRNNGKKLMAVRIVKHAFEIIHLLTDKNPIQVFVDAVKNGGPREDSTRVGSAGVVRRQAVDVSPLRRVNQAIYLICTGARNSAFRNIKSISECLADEIMNCAKESSNSYAIKILVLSCLKLSISF